LLGQADEPGARVGREEAGDRDDRVVREEDVLFERVHACQRAPPRGRPTGQDRAGPGRTGQVTGPPGSGTILAMRVFNHALVLRARLDLGLSQEEVAAAVRTDVRTYRRYESGAVNDPRTGFSVRQPSRTRMLERLGAELGLSMEELLVDAGAVSDGAA